MLSRPTKAERTALVQLHRLLRRPDVVAAALLVSAACSSVLVILAALPGIAAGLIVLTLMPFLALAVVGSTTARHTTRSIRTVLGLARGPRRQTLVVGLTLGVLAFAAGIAIVGALVGITGDTGPTDPAAGVRTDKLTGQLGLAAQIAFWIEIIAIAPLVEELWLRGVVLGSTRRALHQWLPARAADVVSVLLVASVFALAHPYTWIGRVDTFIAGVCLGIARVRTGSIWAAVIAHSTTNALAGLLMAAA